jgi:hypothetical protein
VKILQECHPRRLLIWWCLNNKFTPLPLHATGSFRKTQPTLSDLYISSYTPTLTAFIHAVRKGTFDPSIEQHHFLATGQAQAPGQCQLVLVNTELSSISERIGSVAALTCIQDQDATVAKVVEEFKKTGEFGRGHPSCCSHAVRRIPFRDWHDVGCG